MTYTFILGLEYRYFKNPAKVTVSINNRFVDSFTLTRDHYSNDDVGKRICTKWYNHFGVQNWKPPEYSLPNYFKIYEINDEYLGGEFEIKVDNENSDYTNGFIRNSSVIKFDVIALFPTSLAKNDGEKLMEVFVRLDKALRKKFGKKYSDNPQLLKPNWIIQHDGKSKEIKITKSNRQFRLQWPCVISFNVEMRDKKFSKKKIMLKSEWIGGSFTLKLPIRKKHQVFYLHQEGTLGKGFIEPYKFPIAISSYQPLLNMYNEDHRSNNP